MSFGKTPEVKAQNTVTQVNANDVANAYANSMSTSAAAAGANSTIKTSGQGVGSPADVSNKMVLGI